MFTNISPSTYSRKTSSRKLLKNPHLCPMTINSIIDVS